MGEVDGVGLGEGSQGFVLIRDLVFGMLLFCLSVEQLLELVHSSVSAFSTLSCDEDDEEEDAMICEMCLSQQTHLLSPLLPFKFTLKLTKSIQSIAWQRVSMFLFAQTPLSV